MIVDSEDVPIFLLDSDSQVISHEVEVERADRTGDLECLKA